MVAIDNGRGECERHEGSRRPWRAFVARVVTRRRRDASRAYRRDAMRAYLRGEKAPREYAVRNGVPGGERGKRGSVTWLDGAPPTREEREREVAADREAIREADRKMPQNGGEPREDSREKGRERQCQGGRERPEREYRVMTRVPGAREE